MEVGAGCADSLCSGQNTLVKHCQLILWVSTGHKTHTWSCLISFNVSSSPPELLYTVTASDNCTAAAWNFESLQVSLFFYYHSTAIQFLVTTAFFPVCVCVALSIGNAKT